MTAALCMAGRGGAGDDEGTAVRPRNSIAASLEAASDAPYHIHMAESNKYLLRIEL